MFKQHHVFLLRNYIKPSWCSGIAGGFRAKGLEFKTLYRNTAGIRQEVHAEFEVLRCSSKKSGLKASV